MSFWSKFAKIGAIAGAGAGTVLTAGAATPALGAAIGLGGTTAALGGAAATAGGSILGKLASAGANASGSAAAGMSDGRDREMQNTLLRGRVQEDQNGQAMRAAFAMNVKDAHINRPAGVPNTSMTGGARPSALGPEGIAAAKKNYALSMDHLSDLPDVKAGKLENTLGTIGMIGKGFDQIQAQTQQNGISEQVRRMLAERNSVAAPPRVDDGSRPAVVDEDFGYGG